MVVILGQWMRTRGQRGTSSTAYETAHGQEKADEKIEKEYANWLEESSRSVERHVGMIDSTVYSVKGYLVSQG